MMSHIDTNGKTQDIRPGSQASEDSCHRCGGLKLTDYYMDLQDDTGQIDITVRRCPACGEVIDQIILQNRQGPVPNLLYGTKQRKFSQRVEKPSSGKNEEDDRANH